MQECTDAKGLRCIRAFVHFDERQLTTRCSVSLLTSIFIRCFAFTM